MNPHPDLLYVLGDDPSAAQDTACYSLGSQAVLMQRGTPPRAPEPSASYVSFLPFVPATTEPVVIQVVGVSGADIDAPWVLLLA